MIGLKAVVRATDPAGHEYQVQLSYDVLDPAAITLTFVAGEQVVPWVVSRDLIAYGLFNKVGEGAVKIWPVKFTAVFEFYGADGDSNKFSFFREEIAAFIHGTFTLVPRGKEFDSVDWDQVQQKLIG